MEAVARAIEAHTGYLVDSHRVEFFGLCPECRAAGKKLSRPPSRVAAGQHAR
jgi:Fe2+ or Zn2+ uptake regulation protein